MEIKTELRKQIEASAKGWRSLGHGNVLEEFVLRNGEEFTTAKRMRPIGEKQQCFRNALLLAVRDPDMTYYEGYAWGGSQRILPIHHAWCVDPEGTVIETTWRITKNSDVEYFGVKFDMKLAMKETMANNIYCLLAPNELYNIKFMAAVDPEFGAHLDQIKMEGRL